MNKKEYNKGCWGRWCARLVLKSRKLKAENAALERKNEQLEADLERALRDVEMFEDLANE